MAESGTVDAFAEGTQAMLGWRNKKDSLIERDKWGDTTTSRNPSRS